MAGLLLALAGCGGDQVETITPDLFAQEGGSRSVVATLTGGKRWDTWDLPWERRGRVVGSLVPGQAYEVTGRWDRPVAPKDARPSWTEVSGNHWIRINATDQATGEAVQRWAFVTHQWLSTRVESIPSVALGWGIEQIVIPSGGGARLKRESNILMRAQPCKACDVIAEVVPYIPVPVTGRHENQDGRWFRIEHKQTIGWVEEQSGKVAPRRITAWWLARVKVRERTCTQFAFRREDMWGVCGAGQDGRMLDSFERSWDTLEPFWGRHFIDSEGQERVRLGEVD